MSLCWSAHYEKCVDVALVLFTNFVQSCQRSSAAPGAAMRDAGGSISVHPLSFIKNDNRTGSKAASKTFRRLLT